MAEPSKKHYCRHCSSICYAEQAIRDHLDSQHDITGATRQDFENEMERNARLRREKAAAEHESARVARLTEFELADSLPEMEGVWTVENLLAHATGRAPMLERDPWERSYLWRCPA